MIKTLASQIKEYKRDAILTPFCMIGEVFCEMLIPLLMGIMVNEGVENGDMATIYKLGGGMILLALLGLIFGMLGGKFGARASAGLAKNLREAMFNNIQTFSFSNIDKFSTPSLVTRLTTDVTNIQNVFQMILRMFTRAPITMISAMILSFSVNARLASIYLAAVILLGIFINFIIRKATKYFSEIFPKYDDLNESIQENVTGIRVVKAFVREEDETDKLKRASANIYRLFVNAENIIICNMPAMMLTVYTCILLVSWFGAHFIVIEGMQTGDLMTMLTYCINILSSLMMVSMMFVFLTMSAASGKRICEVLNEKSDLTNPENPVYDIPDGSIDFNHVTFRYHQRSERPVLDDINLHIHSGETIGIIGGTGSSKTSLVNLLSRLYDVESGELMVGGRNVKEYDLETLRDKVSVVLQKNVLFTGTILENLRWGDPDATLEDCKRVCRLACADEFIERFPDGYDTVITQGGTNVSGGQKQRLCIARALLKKPKILILDDSTSAVDTATDAKIRKAMAEEIPATTKIIIAQRISSVQHADRVLVLDNGCVSGFDTHENLIASNEIYREVYESQQGGNGDFDEGGAA